MTPKERAAMQAAWVWMDWYASNNGTLEPVDLNETIAALREALAEQAEQEPNYFGLTHDHTWLSIDKKQYDKLKPEGRMACYVAPVRTKDLTDVEVWKVWDKVADDLGFARAVIAADREKNK